MLLSGTDPESYITEYTSAYQVYLPCGAHTREMGQGGEDRFGDDERVLEEGRERAGVGHVVEGVGRVQRRVPVLGFRLWESAALLPRQ